MSSSMKHAFPLPPRHRPHRLCSHPPLTVCRTIVKCRYSPWRRCCARLELASTCVHIQRPGAASHSPTASSLLPACTTTSTHTGSDDHSTPSRSVHVSATSSPRFDHSGNAITPPCSGYGVTSTMPPRTGRGATTTSPLLVKH
jgi:hypothetical protein